MFNYWQGNYPFTIFWYLPTASFLSAIQSGYHGNFFCAGAAEPSRDCGSASVWAPITSESVCYNFAWNRKIRLKKVSGYRPSRTSRYVKLFQRTCSSWIIWDHLKRLPSIKGRWLVSMVVLSLALSVVWTTPSLIDCTFEEKIKVTY